MLWCCDKFDKSCIYLSVSLYHKGLLKMNSSYFSALLPNIFNSFILKKHMHQKYDKQTPEIFQAEKFKRWKQENQAINDQNGSTWRKKARTGWREGRLKRMIRRSNTKTSQRYVRSKWTNNMTKAISLTVDEEWTNTQSQQFQENAVKKGVFTQHHII